MSGNISLYIARGVGHRGWCRLRPELTRNPVGPRASTKTIRKTPEARNRNWDYSIFTRSSGALRVWIFKWRATFPAMLARPYVRGSGPAAGRLIPVRYRRAGAPAVCAWVSRRGACILLARGGGSRSARTPRHSPKAACGAARPPTLRELFALLSRQPTVHGLKPPGTTPALAVREPREAGKKNVMCVLVGPTIAVSPSVRFCAERGIPRLESRPAPARAITSR